MDNFSDNIKKLKDLVFEMYDFDIKNPNSGKDKAKCEYLLGLFHKMMELEFQIKKAIEENKQDK